MEILEESDDAFPSALPARREVDHAAWVTIQIGCDNTCAFCIVPAVRGKELSRRLGDIVRRSRSWPPTASPRSRCWARTSTPTGGTSAPGQYSRRFADLLRAVGAVAGHPPGPLHRAPPEGPRPETIAAMAECGRSASTSTSRSSRAATGSWPACTGATPPQRYLERLRAARAAIPDLAVTTDVIVGFPGETEDDFAATLEVAEEAGYDAAYTFIFSPRPGTEAAAWVDEFLPPGRDGGADAAPRRRRWSARPWSATKHGSGSVEEVLVEGPSKKDATMTTGRTRQNKLVHFRAPRTAVGSGPAPSPR